MEIFIANEGLLSFSSEEEYIDWSNQKIEEILLEASKFGKRDEVKRQASIIMGFFIDDEPVEAYQYAFKIVSEKYQQ